MTDNRPVTALALTRGPAGAVLAMLDRDGEEARIVGGAVRNVLLGVPLGDIDIATTALPDEVIRRTTAVGFRPVATGQVAANVECVLGHDRTEPQAWQVKARWRMIAASLVTLGMSGSKDKQASFAAHTQLASGVHEGEHNGTRCDQRLRADRAAEL